MMIFVSVLMLMQFGWSNVRGTELERIVIDEITVKPAAWLIARITPEISIRAVGNHLVAPGGGLNILNGCDGMDVVLLLVAALLVAPVSVQWRLAGIVAGSVVIYVANQARILALFYSYRSDKPLFNLLHGTLAPVLLILIATVFFILFLVAARRGQQPLSKNLCG